MTGYILLFSYILPLLTYIDSAPSKGCKIKFKDDLPKKHEPIFLIKDKMKYEIALPEIVDSEGFIELKPGQELLLACTGRKNIMNETQQELNYAVCKAGNKLIIKGMTYDSGVLDCSRKSAASIKKTEEKCFNGKGFILEIGFTINEWYPVVRVCHNILKSESYYTVHTLYGSRLPAKVSRKSGRPGFTRGEKYLLDGFSPDEAYSKESQMHIFRRLFGKETTVGYLSDFMYLSRGHLSPDADFIFSTWQLATYFYINVAPQWQTINGGYWLNIENFSRNIASKLGADFQIATGTHGVTKLADEKGKMHRINLASNGKVPVPEYFWKLLRNPDNNACIGFIVTNNPYLKEAPKHKCSDICQKFGWPTLQGNFVKGYVYCCDYAGMRRAISEVPVFQCNFTLRFK